MDTWKHILLAAKFVTLRKDAFMKVIEENFRTSESQVQRGIGNRRRSVNRDD